MKTNLIQFIPLLIASLLALGVIVPIVFYNLFLNDGIITYEVQTSVKYGILGLFAVGLSVFLRRNIWKYLFTALLVLSLFNFLEFNETRYVLIIGSLEIDLIALPLLVAHILLNSDAFKLPERSRQEIQQENLEELQYFIKKYETKSISELENMNENELIPAAREARKTLLTRMQSPD